MTSVREPRIGAYRSLPLQRVSGVRRLWPLVGAEMRNLFRTRWGVALYCFCMVPAIGRLVMMLIIFGVVEFVPRRLGEHMQSRLPPSMDHLSPLRAEFYFETQLRVMPGMVFFLLLSTVVAARCVARDRTTNALELYWTRGISPWSYVLAKWWGSFLLLASVFVLPPLLLWLVAGMLADDWSLLLASVVPFVRALLGMLVATALLTLVAALVSAISASANLAMAAWTGLLVGSLAVAVVVSRVLQLSWLRSSLSVWDAARVIVRGIAGFDQVGASVWGASAMICCLVAALLWLAHRRIRVTEVLS